jgi:hypothetical protein
MLSKHNLYRYGLVKTIVELLESESAVAAEARRAQRAADAAAIAAGEEKEAD